MRNIAFILVGSSPRMRGTRGKVAQCVTVRRLIPAHAGNTGQMQSSPRCKSVHPRACGEHCGRLSVDQGYAGSSPRMRGTPAGRPVIPPLHRFIPAHAGNTDPLRSWHRPAPVHPRACGEHAFTVAAKSSAGGSSPRMRGTPLCGSRHCVCARFIPAHAGNTLTLRSS